MRRRNGCCPSVGVAGAMLWRGAVRHRHGGGVTIGRSDSDRLAAADAAALGAGAGAQRAVVVRFGGWYISWLSMSLADTYAVGFTAPLIMTVLAVPMLGERIRWRRALSTLVGFGGVLIMLRPGGDLWTPVVLLLLAGTLVMALTRIMTRQLTTDRDAGVPGLLAADLPHGDRASCCCRASRAGAIGASGWLALAFLGLSSGLAHCVFARSYALAPVSALAPYEYTMLPWGVLAGS